MIKNLLMKFEFTASYLKKTQQKMGANLKVRNFRSIPEGVLFGRRGTFNNIHLIGY